ncbi:ATP-binding protein [Rivibacter subsaxonicus]|uniref:Uncharacterized protein n=1 Tax=Rivibacter subsaxonicus TaxID=457575 RepID=A0A4Q7VG50_9BURK|nr:ATP-binding protein [Rivibacter subsaxonicus]RZT94996.1 hypothetical protein EV670_2742 [Rivibacter subsaxonicus]
MSSDAPDLQNLFAKADRLLDRLHALLPADGTAAIHAPDWQAAPAFRLRRRPGALAQAVLEPVLARSAIRLDDLQQIDAQKERFVRNLESFVAGRPANNMLLTGARGTGKSSLVKAGLNAFAARGLRLIEVDKSDLVDLPDLVALVAARPERFIVYCDDLSFDEGERGYKELKSVLDGSIAQASDNLLVVATSNRRHLLPEYMKDNLSATYTDDGELHPGEVVEEKISLSERFGLWVSFYPFSQSEYLVIVDQWLRSFGLDEAAIAAARPQALVWALERGSRSGRVAWQFARHKVGECGA